MFDLQQMFSDLFDHLGVEVEYKPRTSTAFKTLALIKEPENVNEVGSSQIIGQVAEFVIHKSDVQPQIGDIIFVVNKRYKIYEEPLLDPSNLIWKFNAVLERIER